MSPGFTSIRPNRLTLFCSCSTASRMTSWIGSLSPPDGVSKHPASSASTAWSASPLTPAYSLMLAPATAVCAPAPMLPQISVSRRRASERPSRRCGRCPRSRRPRCVNHAALDGVEFKLRCMAEVRENLAVLIGNCNFHGSAPLSVITHDYRGLAGKRQQSCRLSKNFCRGEHCSPVPVCLARKLSRKMRCGGRLAATNGRPYTRNKARMQFLDGLKDNSLGYFAKYG